LIDRPEAEDIGGAINAAIKAIADENEELGGALPRNYNSLEKPILRELLKILNRIPLKDITEDAFREIYQYFLENFAQKEGPKGGEFFTHISLVKLIVDVIEPNYIVSGWMRMIKSRSIIPRSPTDHSQRTTPHHSGVTGIDITGEF
jgi:type I restriction enzyme M protein